MNFSELAQNRRSVKLYEESVSISDAELHALFEDVVLSPSSFNLQHWMFVVVRDSALRAQLRKAAWDQPQVTGASAAILVAGKLDAYKDAPRIYASAPQSVQEYVVPAVNQFYDGKPQLQRDEAIRGASLAAMSLMFAAKARGFDTGPMIGFDPDAVSSLLKLPAYYIPVMLIVIGKAAGESRPRDYRRPLDEVVKLETFDGSGLSIPR
ncbi:MAG: hypothetical protein AMXMBFR84_31040 [Candidatus Hydrogenedentota bacterium]